MADLLAGVLVAVLAFLVGVMSEQNRARRGRRW